MKKTVSIILLLALLMSMTTAFSNVNAQTYGYTKGDANDDSEITMSDVLSVRKYIAGIFGERDINFTAADTDENDDITNTDLLTVRKIIAGLLDEEGNNTDATYHVNRVMIDGRNICRYTVVYTSDNECMKYSAEQFVNYIRNACGINLKLTNDISSVDTYKIVFEFDTEDKDELGTEGYRIFIDENGDVILRCGSARGPIYAMSHFMEEIVGYRFLLSDMIEPDERNREKIAEGNEFTYLYRNDTVEMNGVYDDREVPILQYRTASQNGITYNNSRLLKDNSNDGSDYRAAQAIYGWGIGQLFVTGHSYAYQMCGLNNLPTMADFRTQPCLTSEETYEKIIKYSIDLMKQRDTWNQHFGQTYTQICCSPNDNTDFCTCSACKTIYQIEGSISGTIFRLSNRVVDRLREYEPELEVFTLAYWDARKAPAYTRPNEHVCVCYCISGCNNHTFRDEATCTANNGNERLKLYDWEGNVTSNSSNDVELVEYRRWLELTDYVRIWYYSQSFSFYLSPAPNIFNVYDDIQYLAELGTSGIYSEGSFTVFCNFEFLRGYLVDKMLWDPFMSEEEFERLLNEYLFCYYGEGWQYIREAIDMENEAGDLQGCWTNNYDRPFNQYNKDYIRDNYKYISSLYDKAYEATNNAAEKNRIAYSRLHLEWLGLSATYERDWVNGDADTKADYKARYTNLFNEILAKKIKIFDGAYADSADHPYNSITGCSNFPKSADEIYNPMEWLFVNFTGEWQWNGEKWV